MCTFVRVCAHAGSVCVYFVVLVQGVIGGRPGRAILELCGLLVTLVSYYRCKRTVCLDVFRQRSKVTFHAQYVIFKRIGLWRGTKKIVND